MEGIHIRLVNNNYDKRYRVTVQVHVVTVVVKIVHYKYARFSVGR